MQQTKKFQLNKIDPADTFSPEPLNENMDKLESALAALGGAGDNLDGRVSALEGHKFAAGSYKGDDSETRDIELGFTPAVVILEEEGSGNAYVVLNDVPYFNNLATITIIDGGFRVSCSDYLFFLNNSRQNHVYLAIK